MRLLVCGSRDWTDAELLARELAAAVAEVEHWFWEAPSIVQGGARGADALARAWAEAEGLIVETFPADWDRYGRSAGYRRNVEMLESGVDACLAFSTRWPATRGTGHMCRLAYDAGLPVTFVTPDGQARTFRREGS